MFAKNSGFFFPSLIIVSLLLLAGCAITKSPQLKSGLSYQINHNIGSCDVIGAKLELLKKHNINSAITNYQKEVLAIQIRLWEIKEQIELKHNSYNELLAINEELKTIEEKQFFIIDNLSQNLRTQFDNQLFFKSGSYTVESLSGEARAELDWFVAEIIDFYDYVKFKYPANKFSITLQTVGLNQDFYESGRMHLPQENDASNSVENNELRLDNKQLVILRAQSVNLYIKQQIEKQLNTTVTSDYREVSTARFMESADFDISVKKTSLCTTSCFISRL